MRKPVVCLLAGALALGFLVPGGTAAPALGDKPVRYEYAELSSVRIAAGPAVAGPPGAGNLAPAGFRTAIRWTTGEEEVEVGDWSELGDRLKAPVPKKESPLNVHRLRVLNKLSADGWEMLDRPLGDGRSTGGAGWSFRRRVP